MSRSKTGVGTGMRPLRPQQLLKQMGQIKSPLPDFLLWISRYCCKAAESHSSQRLLDRWGRLGVSFHSWKASGIFLASDRETRRSMTRSSYCDMVSQQV